MAEHKSRIESAVRESLELKRRFFAEQAELIEKAAREMARALRAGNKILIFGNGGSAADAQHIAGELVVRFFAERRGLPAIALTTDTSVLTAIGNDFGFEQVFSRQVEALGRAGDVALAISTSGNSPNVLRGVEKARALGLITIALTGSDGGLLGKLVDCHINVRHPSTPRVQEVHSMVGHILCQLVEDELFQRSRDKELEARS